MLTRRPRQRLGVLVVSGELAPPRVRLLQVVTDDLVSHLVPGTDTIGEPIRNPFVQDGTRLEGDTRVRGLLDEVVGERPTVPAG